VLGYRFQFSVEKLMGIGIWELAVLLLIVLVLFGTKKLRTIGGDLGSAIKSFRGALREDEENKPGEIRAGGSAAERNAASD
jgi:sec-independent protein translocase protein TatA